jgi:hypothetical protein
MRVCDLKQKDIVVGLRIRGLAHPDIIGTIVKVDPKDDDYAWIQWSNYSYPFSGFYGTSCECEVVQEEQNKKNNGFIKKVYTIDPCQDAAGFFTKVREEGLKLIKLIRTKTRVTVWYRKTKKNDKG